MKNSTAFRSSAAALKDVRSITLLALFAAMSIVLGKMLAFNIGPTIRISFENLPILMAGIFLGAPAGMVTGILADIIGCLIVGYSINPIITVGAASIGLVSGLIYQMIPTKKDFASIFGSVMTAHVIGSMIIKSIGLMVYYQYPLVGVLPRIPLYIAIGSAEAAIILMLVRNHAFTAQLGKFNRR